MTEKRATTDTRQSHFDRSGATSEIFANLRRALDLAEKLINDALGCQKATQAPQQQTTPAVEARELQRSDKTFYTIKEVCEITRLGRSTVYKAISKKHIQTHKWGHRTLVSNDALQTWITNWKSEPATRPL